MHDLYIGAYWGPRQESIGHCADRLMTCLEELSSCDEVFSQWHEKGNSRKDSLQRPFDFRSHGHVLRLLEAGRLRRDLDRSVIDELGFHIGLWNGRPTPRSVTLSFSCGLYSTNTNFKNSVVVNLPEDLGDLSDKNICLQALVAVADAWDPDWAGVISRASRDARRTNPNCPFIDWMFYTNRIGIDHANLPATANASEVKAKGTVIIVQDRPIDPTRPIDIANVNRVEDAIGKMG